MAQRKDPLGMMTTLEAIQNSGPTSPTKSVERILISLHTLRPMLESTLLERGAIITPASDPGYFRVGFPPRDGTGTSNAWQAQCGSWREVKGPLRASVWFETSIGSHDIVEHRDAALDFKEKTGLDACWPTHSVRATRRALQARGVGGTVNGEPDDLVAWGFEMVEATARLLLPNFHCIKTGRGGVYFAALEALREAGI